MHHTVGRGAPSGGSASARDGLLPKEDSLVIALSEPGGALNVRDAPRPSGALLGTLPNGTTRANVGGCTLSDGGQWRKIQAERGSLRGWVAARFLALPGPGGSENSATADHGGGAMAGSGARSVRVRFTPGTTGAELTGDLLPSQSRRYLLGAAAGQELYFRLAAKGPGMGCLRAVAGPSGANNRIVEVMSSETSEANNLVMVAVGDQRAPWRCLVKNGQVAEVMFAGSEGTL